MAEAEKYYIPEEHLETFKVLQCLRCHAEFSAQTGSAAEREGICGKCSFPPYERKVPA